MTDCSVIAERQREQQQQQQEDFLLPSSCFLGISLLVCVCWQLWLRCPASSVCSMEAKSLFSLHRALAQPVKMCMFDFPVTILDDLVSSSTTVCV